MSSRVILDTGALYAMADQDDAWHDRVAAWIATSRDVFVIPVTVLPEACHLMNTWLGQEAEVRFVSSLIHKEQTIENLSPPDVRRANEVLRRYSDANIGFVDATVVALAERLGIRRLVTTDRRHFGIIRPRHCPAFELLP